MKICQVQLNHKQEYGVIEGDLLHLLAGNPLNGIHLTGETAALADCRLLAPLHPGKIVCVGKNYYDHVIELADILEPTKEVPQEPLLFLKPPSAVIGPEETIVYPSASHRLDFEAELAVVIGKKAKDLQPGQWPDYVFGYTCINDVTARDLQKADIQWTRAKGFDTFSPLGPWIETELDPTDVGITSRLNGKTMQSESTRAMIHNIDQLLCFISGIMTLEPGDVIATGTPVGIDSMKKGDVIEITIEGIGTLRNLVG